MVKLHLSERGRELEQVKYTSAGVRKLPKANNEIYFN
jgi:hypothetical protein